MSWAAVAMTQQYLAGEMSLLLAQLEVAASGHTRVRNAAHLRREAETVPLAGLSSVAVRALVLADGLCWDSLGRGDVSAFARHAALCAELQEFGVCSSLLDDA
jgi:hypothetical protein